MKFLFFNRFFYPDTSATAQILSDLAFHLAAKGHEVHVVTSHPGDGAGNDTVKGVHVHRVARSTAGPHSLARRALDYVNYYRAARGALDSLVGPGDVVVAKTDPPMLSAALARRAKSRGARLIVWLQDLFPEVAREYGVAGMRTPLYGWLSRRRDASLRAADAIVAVGRGMAERVTAAAGLDRARVHVIDNWSDGAAIVPTHRSACALRKAWGLEEKFLVVYSGNFGRVHEFGTLLGAAARLQGDSDIRFVLIGRGPRLAEVQAQAAGLGNVEFRPHLPRESLSQGLALGDVHVVVLDPAFESLVQPSKLYGVMAAGRPTLSIGSVTGETARVVGDSESGIAVTNGDVDGLVAAIQLLRSDAHARERLGSNARRAFERDYDMPIALAKWEKVLNLPG